MLGNDERREGVVRQATDAKSKADRFSVTHALYHLMLSNRCFDAAKMALSFKYLMIREEIGQVMQTRNETKKLAELMSSKDVEYNDSDLPHSVALLHSALQLVIADGVREDWKQLPGQLIARPGYYCNDQEESMVKSVAQLVEEIKKWDGDGQAWWCPYGPQSLESAGGACTEELRGHKDWVQSVSWWADGTKICSGSTDESVIIHDVETREILHRFFRKHG